MRMLILFVSVIGAAASSAYAVPCTSPSGCTEWVNLGAGQARSLIYRTYPLDARNEKITRALIMIHGAGRDADNYFRTAVAAAFLANGLDDTIVIAPRFASNDGRSCRDTLDANEISWSCSGDSWRSGGVAAGDERLTSYDLTDEILRKLARKEVFPNLKAIVVAGHSAGGQYATRFGMANQVHDKLGVPVTYVVSNPSSYAYLDPERPGGEAGELRSFGDARNCTTYDRWPYGLQNRTGYSARLTDDQLKKQLAARPVTYLLGGLDTLPLAGFDSSCPAMAQGPTRLARGQAFAAYVNKKYAAQHKLVVIPLCGHNARCMFTAEPALAILFPKF
ncbi:MAG TPA: alpha/beta fold hydrolase [Acidobacteriota bacterium]|jgi:pimeloyl-ACP methyl ester carboxylesterase